MNLIESYTTTHINADCMHALLQHGYCRCCYKDSLIFILQARTGEKQESIEEKIVYTFYEGFFAVKRI